MVKSHRIGRRHMGDIWGDIVKTLNLPNSGDLAQSLVTGGTTGAGALLAKNVAGSTAIQTASKGLAFDTAVAPIKDFFVQNPKLAIGLGVAIVGGLGYWFIIKKK